MRQKALKRSPGVRHQDIGIGSSLKSYMYTAYVVWISLMLIRQTCLSTQLHLSHSQYRRLSTCSVKIVTSPKTLLLMSLRSPHKSGMYKLALLPHS